MDRPGGAERRAADEHAAYGVQPQPYGVTPAPYGVAPGPYAGPAFLPSAQALSPNRRSAARRAADGLLGFVRAIGSSLWETLQEILLAAALAAVPVGLFALLGYAIGGSTGAWLGAIAGVGVFYVLKFFVLVAIATWGASQLLTRRRRD